MSTRARAAFLRGLGFKKSDWVLTRGTIQYEHPEAGVRVTIRKGDEMGGSFIIMGGCFNFTSGMMFVGNLAAGCKASIQHLFSQGIDVPCPSRADYGEPEYMDDLFRALVFVSLNSQIEKAV